MRLAGKVVLVTGSTMGIGKAIAQRVVAEGGKVLVHGLEPDSAEAVVAELGQENAAGFIADLADPDSPQKIVKACVDAFGRIDCLVNNAGIVLRGKIEDTDVFLWDKIMRVNARAPFLMIKAALQQLSDVRGAVVNIGSVNAYCGEGQLMAYSVSKGALMTLTRNLGDTLHCEYGIRVNQINPGWVLTENEIERKREHGMDDDWYTKLPKQFAPSGRILYPEEIAASVVHFLSDELGPVSGTVLELEQHPFIGRNPEKV